MISLSFTVSLKIPSPAHGHLLRPFKHGHALAELRPSRDLAESNLLTILRLMMLDRKQTNSDEITE